MNADFWRGRRVVVTGHTGFKGGWLVFWLKQLGADVAGIGLAPDAVPSLHGILGIDGMCQSVIADINRDDALLRLLTSFRPEVVIHLAAQSLVRASYADPVATYEANVMTVVRLLDAVRRLDHIRSVVVVTSDKCYQNSGQVQGYREDDRLGGRDPYSSSKSAAEIATQSMQRSFFAPYLPDGHPARIATVRAGNVIGGGDWSKDRLVPDIIRAIVNGDEIRLRHPQAVRPWQHVLDALGAYLLIAELLAGDGDRFDEAWNIGPPVDDARSVLDLASAMVAAFGQNTVISSSSSGGPHEAHWLALDCTKAHARMNWRPWLGFEDAVRLTADWYDAWRAGGDMARITRDQLADFERRNPSLENCRDHPR